jgi:hypothetical protein
MKNKEEILNDIQAVLIEFVNLPKFDNLSNEEKNKIINQKLQEFEIGLTSHIINNTPKDILNDDIKLEAFLESANISNLTIEYFRKFIANLNN